MIAADPYRGEVRRSRARSTGALVMLIDAAVPGDYQVDEGGRWVTFCDAHGQFCQHETRRLAESFLPWPTDWCEACAAEHSIGRWPS